MNTTTIIILSIILFAIVFVKLMHAGIEEEIGIHKWVFGWMKWNYFVTIIKFMRSYKNMDKIKVVTIWDKAHYFSSFSIIFKKNNDTIVMDTREIEINCEKLKMCLFQYLIWRHYMHKIRRYENNQKKIKSQEKSANRIEKMINSIEKTTVTENEKKGALSISESI